MTGEFLTPVRAFNDLGIAAVRRLLERMRKEGKFLPDAIELLLADPTYTELVPDVAPINRTLEFKTKLEFVEYLLTNITEPAIYRYRLNSGLWTWLALAWVMPLHNMSYPRRGLIDAKIVHEVLDWRTSRRHLVSGPLFLYLDIFAAGPKTVDLLFTSHVSEFSKTLDVLTLNRTVLRSAAQMKVLTELVYDPKTTSRTRKGVRVSKFVIEYVRVMHQLARTWDFNDEADASLLWAKLPYQYDSLKNRIDF